MPVPVVGPAPRFGRTMVVAALSHVVTSTFSALLAVYLDRHKIPAVSVSGYALAGSYLASVLLAGLAHRGFAVPTALFLMALGAITLSGDSFVLLGGIAFVLGSGLFRVAIVVQIAQARPPAMSREYAFSIYTAVVNGGYIVGPFLAELVRSHFGWLWVFVAMSITAGAGFVLSMLLMGDTLPSNGQHAHASDIESDGLKPGVALVVVLLGVALFYGISQVASGNFALLVEKESLPIQALHGWSLKAGSLAALHGAMVLAGSILLSLRQPSWSGTILACLGLALYAAVFILMAGLRYPVSQTWIVLAFAGLSAAETAVGPTLLALGSRLTSRARGLYWLAAAAGYWVSGSMGLLWERWSHRQYFSAVALACVVVAALIAWRARVPAVT